MNETPGLNGFLVIPATRTQIAALRWVNRACSKDEARPALQGICFTENQWVALDGFRIHVAGLRNLIMDSQKDLWPADGGPYELRGIIRGNLVVLQKIGLAEGNKYPDYQSVIDNARKGGLCLDGKGPAYVATFSMNPRLLADSLNYTGNTDFRNLPTYIEIRGGPVIFKICNQDEVDLTAYIMPMYADDGPRFVDNKNIKQSARLKAVEEVHIEK